VTIASVRAGAWARVDAACARASERFDAVVVKDVRQALRSRFFGVIFICALVLTSAGGFLVLAKYSLRPQPVEFGGLPLYAMTVLCASIGAVALVPFAAFASMSAETDENAIDLLGLSRLTPVAIVRGKLVTACVQALLVYCVCVPWLCIAWAIGKVDPILVASTFAELFALSVALSAIAIALASLARGRVLRVVSVAILLATGAFVARFAFEPFEILNGWVPNGAITTALLWAAAFACVVPLALAFAAEGVAHRETSTSTPLRLVASSFAFAGALFDAGWIALRGAYDATEALVPVFALLAVPLLWLVAERERLPASVRAHPPWDDGATWIRSLHLAGGGRGALLATLAIGGVCAVHAFAVLAFAERSAGYGVVYGLATAACTWVYLLLPSVLLARLPRHLDAPAITRGTIALLVPFAFIAAESLARVFGGAWRALALASPSYLADQLCPAGQLAHPVLWSLFLALVGLTFALNVPRMRRGVLEVREAQRAQRSSSFAAEAV